MLAGVLEDLGVDDADLDPPRFLQALAQRLGHRQRMVERAAERFRRLLELGPVVALGLDIVADPGLGRDQHAGIGPGVARRMPPKFAERGVEPGDSLGDRGRIVGQFDQFGAADAEVGEHRIGKYLAELARSTRLRCVGRERFDIDVERFGQAQQDAGGDRPLVALEMVEVGAGDAELVGHLALVEAAVAPQPLQPGAEEELALHHHRSTCEHFYKLHKS